MQVNSSPSVDKIAPSDEDISIRKISTFCYLNIMYIIMYKYIESDTTAFSCDIIDVEKDIDNKPTI